MGTYQLSCPEKEGGRLLERGTLFERGGLIEDLRYMAYFRKYPPENLYIILPLHPIAPREGIRTLESENFCPWNLESWTLESTIHL